MHIPVVDSGSRIMAPEISSLRYTIRRSRWYWPSSQYRGVPTWSLRVQTISSTGNFPALLRLVDRDPRPGIDTNFSCILVKDNELFTIPTTSHICYLFRTICREKSQLDNSGKKWSDRVCAPVHARRNLLGSATDSLSLELTLIV